MKDSPLSVAQDEELMGRLWEKTTRFDLRKWTQIAFPWGQPNTVLHDRKEPKKFQIEMLEEATEYLRTNDTRALLGLQYRVYRKSISSGRGIGKSALFEGILPLWFISTQLGGSCIVTANNDDQLRNRTWGELGVWYNLLECKHWFEKSTEKVVPAPFFKKWVAEQLNIDSTYYYIEGRLWNADNPSGFAGNHSQYAIMVIFAEAAGIPKSIWTVANGYHSDVKLKTRIWLASSNPREATGGFYDTHHAERDDWHPVIIDSRSVEGVDIEEANKILAKYGENSPEACAEVTGQFPDLSDKQFIPRSIVKSARIRELPPRDDGAPIVIGVDPARQGNDKTVIQVRQGRDARSYPTKIYEGIDNVAVAGYLIELVNLIQKTTGLPPDAINVDVGNGAGVIDICRARGLAINEVDFGKSAPKQPARYANWRTEMYADCREWLPGGCVPDVQHLEDDLTGPWYGFKGDSSVIILESKDSMRKRGLHSPDWGDALVLTFAVPLARRDLYQSHLPSRYVTTADGLDYNPLG